MELLVGVEPPGRITSAVPSRKTSNSARAGDRIRTCSLVGGSHVCDRYTTPAWSRHRESNSDQRSTKPLHDHRAVSAERARERLRMFGQGGNRTREPRHLRPRREHNLSARIRADEGNRTLLNELGKLVSHLAAPADLPSRLGRSFIVMAARSDTPAFCIVEVTGVEPASHGPKPRPLPLGHTSMGPVLASRDNALRAPQRDRTSNRPGKSRVLILLSLERVSCRRQELHLRSSD